MEEEMKNKITFFLGSPRKRGNTTHVIAEVSKILKQKGVASELVFLPDFKIKPCKECFACQKVEDKPGCRIKDDMKKMYKKMLRSEAIVLASPVFCWSFSAQIKPFIDRCYCFGKYEAEPMISLLKGKRCSILITAGGDESDGAGFMAEGFSKMADFFQMENLGALVIGKYTGHDVLKRKDIQVKIKAFANKLLKQAKAD
jgi:multimeric flavodoxin WrbA